MGLASGALMQRHLSEWATVDPKEMTEAKPGVALNIGEH